MATFQLGGLPNMQISNQNAPSSSVDVIPNQPRENIGLTLLQGAAGVLSAKGQYDAQQKAKQDATDLKNFQAKFGTAFAAGDRDSMKSLAKDYPAQFETITKGMGLIDADHKTEVGNTAMDLKLAASQGPEAVAAVAQRSADTLKRMGLDPTQLVQQFQQNPDEFGKLTDLVGMQAVGPDKYFDIQDKREGRALDRDKLAETIRNNNAGNAQGWANIGLRREALENDVEMRKIAAQQVGLQRQLQSAKTEQEIQVVQQKLADAKEKAAGVEQTKQMGSAYALEAANIADKLAKDPSLTNITGVVSTRLPTLRNSSQDLINNATRLQSLLTQDNLKLMSGVLTDRDIEFLGRISSGLNVTENGIKGSEQATRAQLNSISNKLVTGLKGKGYVPNDYVVGQPQPQQQMQQQQMQQQAPQQQAPQQAAQPAYQSLWGG